MTDTHDHAAETEDEAGEPPHTFLIAMGAMLVTLACGELYFRGSPLDDSIEKARAVTMKTEAYKHVGGDIVVTGDSRMFHAVVPAVMNETIHSLTGATYTTFNFSSPAATTPVFLMAAHEAARRKNKPRVFVIGLSPVLMSFGDTVEIANVSPLVKWSNVPVLVRATFWSAPEEAAGSVAYASSRLLSQRTDVLIGVRDLKLIGPPVGTYEDNWGWVSLGGRTSPEIQNMRAIGRAGAYGALMDKSKGMKPKPLTARYLEVAVRDLQAAGIHAVIMGTPQARQLDVNHDAAHTYFEYLDMVRGISARTGAPFADLNDFPGLENLDFTDGDHLTEGGANKLTRHLATTVIAPLLR